LRALGRAADLLASRVYAIGRHVRAGQALFAEDSPIRMKVKDECAAARVKPCDGDGEK
jgi:hypothetical protein